MVYKLISVTGVCESSGETCKNSAEEFLIKNLKISDERSDKMLYKSSLNQF